MSQLSFTPIDFDPFEQEREIDKIVFTNEPQKEIWLSCLIGGKESSLAYNESVSLDLEGDFHAAYFIEAIAEVISRHETLRSTVSANGETLIIYKHLSTNVPVEDISADPDQQVILHQFIADEMVHEFDLQEGPLFRCFLHKLSETHYFFTIVKHHVIGDGWSTGVILEDLSKLYNAKVQGVSLSLPEAPQISQYAAEMAASEQTPEYLQTKKYWLDMYRDNVPVLDLQTDYPRPARRSYKANRIDYHLPLELVEQVKKMGAKCGCSLVNTLLSTFEIFLHLQTSQNDIVVGLPSSGQAATGHFGLAGHCVNLLPIRSIIDQHLSFSDYLKARKAAFFDAYDHQQFTFGELVKGLNVKRDSSRIPLVPVVFNIDMGMDNAVVFDHLTYKLISNPRAYETFEIFLNATGSKSSFVLEWSYNTQLFKADTIEKMAAAFESLLQTLVSDPSVTLKELSGKNTALWIQQLDEWNATAASYPKDSTLTELIGLTAGAYPGKVAVVYKNESLTYARLTELSNQLAACLIAKGVTPGDIIGLAADRSVEMIVSLLGILKAGAVYLPLDPEYPQERIEYMLTDSGAKILLLSTAYSGRYQSDALEMVIEEIWPDLDNYPAAVPVVNSKGTDLAYVLYTSGSTGKPKGVEIMHYNLVNFLISMQSAPGITAEDRLLAITTISFDIAGLELYLPLITGAELVICDRDTARDGRLLLDLIETQGITFMQATPSTWRMMIDSGWQKKYPFKVLCGGEAFPDGLAAELLNLSAEVWNMYGPTETTIWSAIKQIKADGGVITIGRPINNTQVYILDADRHLVALGATGEIFIGGDGLAAGYLNQPELTKERFIANPFSIVPGARLYMTGDLGKFTADGEIICLGRADQQVKIRGHRIELGEIETLLSQQEGIKQSVVIAREDNPGDKRLVAYVILSKEETEDNLVLPPNPSPVLAAHAKPHDFARTPLSANEVYLPKSITDDWKRSLYQQLPDYMVPADFVALKSFPLTPNHKIDKKALPKPQVRIGTAGITQHLPQDEHEQFISSVWSAVLGIETIDTHDDFFELGGHSLLAVKVMSAIEKETGKRLPLATLFDNSTIEKLAKKMVSDEESEWKVLVPIKTAGTKDPIFLIHGGGLNVILFKAISKYLDKEQPVYGLQAQGLNHPTQLLYTMEEIAALYISEIIAVNPNGPYCLAGYSLGGFIAFEISRQLIEMGKTVKFLGILDTYAGNKNISDNISAKLSIKVKRQFNKIPFFTRSFLRSPREAVAYQVNVFKYKFEHMFSKDMESYTEHFSPYEKEIFRSYDIAHLCYKLAPADIKISLFNVRKRLYYLDDLVYLGWDNLANKGIEIHGVPGDHKTFLYPPNDREFAKILQAALDNI